MEHSQSCGVRDRIGSTRGVELVDELTDVEFGGVDRDAEPSGDVFVGRALGQKPQHFGLAWGEQLIEVGLVPRTMLWTHEHHVAALAGSREPQPRNAVEQSSQSISKRRVVNGERDDDRIRLRCNVIAQVSGLSPITISTGRT